MDYAFWSTVLLSGVAVIVASYDIACQWSVNLRRRLAINFAGYYTILAVITIVALIPNFHLRGHGPKCEAPFSYHTAPNVGTTHGETVEQEWGHIGPVAVSTREMGPSARHATLDDHWSGWNFRKVVGFGECRVRVTRSVLTMFTGDYYRLHLPDVLEQREKHERLFPHRRGLDRHDFSLGRGPQRRKSL